MEEGADEQSLDNHGLLVDKRYIPLSKNERRQDDL